MASKRNIALTGFMAVGKSAVGRKLAKRLKRPFIDVDRLIEEAERMKVAEIFERKGEAYFRVVEKRTLREVLDRDGQVIATGGGAIVDEENLSLLQRRSLLVCLIASPETLLRRSRGGKRRPLLEGAAKRRRIAALLKEREPCYAQAHALVDTGRLSVDEVVEEVIKVIQEQTASRLES